MRPLPLVRQLTARPLAKPCDEAWSEMRGDDKVRHCVRCERDVYALSAMTEFEAEVRLLNAGTTTPCIRYQREEHGDVRHLPGPVLTMPWRPARAALVASALGTTLLVREADVGAKPTKKPEQAQCVVLPPPAAASEPAEVPLSAGLAAERPAARVPDREPPMMAGEPPMIEQQPVFGTLVVKSKKSRKLKLHGLDLVAPLDDLRLTPGTYAVEVFEDGKRPRKLKLKVVANNTATLDLDR